MTSGEQQAFNHGQEDYLSGDTKHWPNYIENDHLARYYWFGYRQAREKIQKSG